MIYHKVPVWPKPLPPWDPISTGIEPGYGVEPKQGIRARKNAHKPRAKVR